MKNSKSTLLLLTPLLATFFLISFLLVALDNEERAEENLLSLKCEEAVSLPYAGIRYFSYCLETQLVWDKYTEEWRKPGTFESKRISQWKAPTTR